MKYCSDGASAPSLIGLGASFRRETNNAPLSMTPAQIEAYVDAAAPALQLPRSRAPRPGVLRYFALAAEMAALVAAHPLEPADDPAEAFVPIAPASGGR